MKNIATCLNGVYCVGDDHSYYLVKGQRQKRLSNFIMEPLGYVQPNGIVLRVFKLTNEKGETVAATFTPAQLIEKSKWKQRLVEFCPHGKFDWLGTMTDIQNMKPILCKMEKLPTSFLPEWIKDNIRNLPPFYHGELVYTEKDIE